MHSRKEILYIPVINSQKITVYKDIFNKELVHAFSKLYLENFPLVIFPEDFAHICYESKKGGRYKGKFSFRRARKILLIREVCKGNLPYKVIFQTQRENKSICILLEYAEFAAFVVPQQSNRGTFLRLLTIISYGKQVESVMKKQRKAGVLVKNIEEAVRLRGSTAPESRQINKYPD
jgi:hypothetical protein